MPDSPSQEQAVEARRLAEEALEWVRDFEAGQVHVICQRCQAPHPYLPVEFYGLVESQKELATLLSQREAELVEAQEALRETRRWLRPEVGGRFDQHEAVTAIDRFLSRSNEGPQDG